MLVLKREIHEEVIITVPPSTEPATIRVVVVDLDRGVKLGFDAPPAVVVDRKEIHERRTRGVLPIPEGEEKDTYQP